MPDSDFTEEFDTFLSALRTVGEIPEMASWATDEFGDMIRERYGDRSLLGLTIGEILELNQVHKEKVSARRK